MKISSFHFNQVQIGYHYYWGGPSHYSRRQRVMINDIEKEGNMITVHVIAAFGDYYNTPNRYEFTLDTSKDNYMDTFHRWLNKID